MGFEAESPMAGGDGSVKSAEREPGHAGAAKGRKSKQQRPFWKEFPILVGIALVLAVVIKTFAVQAFYIPSGSMENTLRIGDRVLVNKIVYHMRDIQRGDIVVFKVPASWNPEVTYQPPSNPVSQVFHAIGGFFGVAPGETDYIKRVIGLPGDHVTSAGNGAPVLVNGHPLAEKSYLFPGNAPSSQPFDVVVPPGRLWVMGDHRAESADSRAHPDAPGGGSIPQNLVIGRAFVVVWPVGNATALSIPQTFQQPGLAAAALSATPAALGFAVTVPIFWLRRRRGRRRSA